MSTKIVIITAVGLPSAIAANACALLALTIGTRHPDLIGPDIPDADGTVHTGISGTPVPVLTAPVEKLAELAGAAAPVETIGFTRTAARARTYDAYTAEMASTPTHELEYLALALLGPTKVINSLTGSLPLLK